jgi:hypothetical protein
MPKDRTVDRFFWDDPDVGLRLSRDERLLMVGCWTKLADDEGRFLADAGYVRKEIFGYDDLQISEVSAMLQKISEMFRSWHLYVIGTHQYIQIDPLTWNRHQGIRWTCKSKLPQPSTQVNGNTATSVYCEKLPQTSEDFRSRDARAVGLGSVVLGSENHCASDDAPLFDLAPTVAHPPRNWKRKLFDEEFWPNAWRKVAKIAAWNSFEAKAKTSEQGEKIVAAMLAQKPAYENRETDKRPYMSTWLNQERFSDDGPEVQEAAKADQTPYKVKNEWTETL